MADRPPDEDDRVDLAADDGWTQGTCLSYVIAQHPVQVSEEELIRAMADDPEDFAQRDAVRRAVRTLYQAGLLLRGGDTIAPSRAALLFNQIVT
jgi:hypothetical protein